MMKIEKYENLVKYTEASVAEFLRQRIKEPICEWVENNVDLSFDHSAAASGLVKLYPYQREILEACDDPDVKQVTIQAGQRLGKSQCWKFSLLKRVHDGGLSGIILYPSLDLAEKTNRDTVKPLLCSLPEVSKDLAIRGNIKTDSYHMPTSTSLLYFMGGQSQVVSLTANWVCLDECDFVDVVNSDADKKNMSQIKALRLRMQSFKKRLMIVCSSPTSYGGAVHTEWKDGSMGEWCLRCLNCGQLMPTKQLAWYIDGEKWGGLQWAKDENHKVINDSIRYICPHCQHEHVEKDAMEMNLKGAFVHIHPEIKAKRSYQIGALSNPILWTWKEIAEAQEAATDADGKKYLANTILGMPYRHVAEGDAGVSIEESNKRRQVSYPADLQERLSIVLAGVDQQKSELAGEKYYVAVVRGWDEQGNSWLLSEGLDHSIASLRERLTQTYYGHRVSLALIDQGGFSNAEDLDILVNSLPIACYYKGAGAKELDGKTLTASKNQHKLFLANAVAYQVKLLDLLYSPKRPSGYGWYLPLKLSEEYFRQLCNVQPNTRMGKDSNGYEYANWAAFNSSRRDFFDAEKMALCCLDVACAFLPHTAFRRGHVPLFVAREKLLEMARKAKIQKQ